MTEEGIDPSEPLLEPKLIKRLRERPRLVGGQFREQMLENLEENIAQRRTPEVVAERLSQESFKNVVDITEPVVREGIRDRLDRANETVLEGL